MFARHSLGCGRDDVDQPIVEVVLRMPPTVLSGDTTN
jgi:hypothetical protein